MATDTVTINGETHTVTEWLQKIGLSVSGYQKRLKSGMTPEKALTMTNQKPGREIHPVVKAEKKPVKEKPKQRTRVFVRNGGGAGTWRWIET